MSTTDPNPAPTQAQITNRLVIRTSLLLIVIAALIYAFQYYRSIRTDLGGRQSSETGGLIAAIERKKGGGQEAVLIKPNGEIVRSGGWKEGVNDRDLAWSPDGNFLFFISDRVDKTFHVMRWAPGTNNVEPRSIGSRGKSNPTFPAMGVPDASKTALITSGGVVFEFDPSVPRMIQMLPPTVNEIVVSGAEEGGGSESQFQGFYGQIGQAFRLARWMKGKDWVAAIMKRDNGEVLIAQNLQPNKDGKLNPPVTLTAGEHIDIDVSPKTGALVYSVVGFQWPPTQEIPAQFRQGNRVTTPFRHMIGLFDPEDKASISAEDLKKQATEGGTNGPVVVSPNDDNVFTAAKFSPDGETLVAVAGRYDVSSSSVEPGAVITMPAKVGGAREIKPVAQGEVFEPSWNPSGRSIVFARRTGGKRAIFTVDREGGSERNVTGDQGDFSNPLYSPQTK
jgi:hypothetical protein